MTTVLQLVHCLTLVAASDGSGKIADASTATVVECVEKPTAIFEPTMASNQSLLPFTLDLSVKLVRTLFVGQVAVVNFNLSSTKPQQTHNVSLHVEVPQTSVATAIDSEILLDWLEDDRSSGRLYDFGRASTENFMLLWSGSFSVKGTGIGHASAKLAVTYSNTTKNECRSLRSTTLPISVLRAPRMVDLVFDITLYALVISSGIASALKIDLHVVKEALKRPKAPAIGFLSQFIIMPLVSYGIIMTRGYVGGTALGLFALGTSPGGGQSNLYALLLDGDLSISITMTLISTFAALGMMPLWIYTLGTKLPGNENFPEGTITIPFINILTTIATITVPAAVGLLIRWKFPKCAAKVVRWLKVPMFVVLLAFVGFVVYASWFVFSFFDAETLLSCAVLPYGGFLLGGLVAFAARLEWKLVLTIAIETGINNANVAVLLVRASLPQPDADLSLVPIMAALVMTPLPLLLVFPVYAIYKKKCKRNDPDVGDEKCKDGHEKMIEKKRSGVAQDGSSGKGRGSSSRDEIEDVVSLVGSPKRSVS